MSPANTYTPLVLLRLWSFGVVLAAWIFIPFRLSFLPFYPIPFLVYSLCFHNHSTIQRRWMGVVLGLCAAYLLSPIEHGAVKIYEFYNLQTSNHAPLYAIISNTNRLFLVYCLIPVYCMLKPSRPLFSWPARSLSVLRYTLIACIFLLIPAIRVGYIRWDPSLPSHTSIWLWHMLFVCVSEEIIYRGVLHNALITIWPKRPYQVIACGALLFACNHLYQGGPILSVFAGISGVFYAHLYHQHRALSSSIALHYLVNAVHFFLLSYPRYQAV